MALNIKIDNKQLMYPITLEQNGQTIVLSEQDYKNLYRKVETEMYYKSDILNYFSSENQTEFDNDAVLADTDLIDAMTEHYASLRFENNGGDPDTMLDWQECLTNTCDAFADNLLPYRY